MSARRHRRVKPGPVGGRPDPGDVRQAQVGLYATRLPAPHVWRHCDYCGTSMAGQEFRGDKCLDCRLRDSEAEVDEHGEEIVDDDTGRLPR